ncbi:MAG: pyruvate kinase, partial [Anaerolineales bacterium]
MSHDINNRRTKIVATLGPASLRPDTIAAMLRAGMNVVRLNTSHGTISDHVAAVRLVREVAAEEDRAVAVLMDLGGPKLRSGPTLEGAIEIVTGSEVSLVYEHAPSTPERITVEYPRLTQDVLAGHRVLLDDGNIELEVVRVDPEGLVCRVMYGGLLGPNKGVAFPGSTLTLPALT